MKPRPTLTKMEMIECSLRCFMWGLPGLLPVIGVPMAVRALLQYRRVKFGQGDMWNPAHCYLFWGGVCARFGLILPLLLVTAIIAIVVIEDFA
jgi:hypothetical protein